MDEQLQDVTQLYERLIDAWNRRDAAGMASLYAPKGSQVGFDGSMANGPEEIKALLQPIFADHPTARFVTRIRETRAIGPGAAMLRAVAGMIPPGGTDIMPERNAVQTLVASRGDGGSWRVEMFHNTPAAFDGRPEEAEKLTAELRKAMVEAEERELA